MGKSHEVSGFFADLESLKEIIKKRFSIQKEFTLHNFHPDLGAYIGISDIRELSVNSKLKVVFSSPFPFPLPIRSFGSYGPGKGQFNFPSAIAVSSSGEIFIVDHNNNRIQVINSEGKFIFEFGSKGDEFGQFIHPEGIAIDNKTKRVFIADKDNNRIQSFDFKGNFLQSFGSFGKINGCFWSPRGITTDKSGIIYVADSNNHRVQIFDLNGTFLRKIGAFGEGKGELRCPWGIGKLSTGELVVSEWEGNRLSVFNPDGTFVRHLGETQLSSPQHIFIDHSDNILVCNTGLEKITVFFAPEGKIIKEIQAFSPAVALDNEGNMIIAKFDNQISVFHSANLLSKL